MIKPAPADQGGITQDEIGYTETISQSTHGFLAFDVVRWTGATWTKAQADTAENAGDGFRIGIVDNVPNTNSFVLREKGILVGAHGISSSDGMELFLKAGDPGMMVTWDEQTTAPICLKLGSAINMTHILVDIDEGYATGN